MNIPNPPTDNLYKFCALSGTIIVLLSIYIPLNMDIDLDGKLAVVELNVSKAEVETKFLQHDAEEYKKAIENYGAHKKNRAAEVKAEFPIYVTNKEFREGVLALRNALKEQELKRAEIQSDFKATKRLFRQLIIVWVASSLLLVFGYGLAKFGFRCWYDRVQVYQDKLLQQQVESMAPQQAPGTQSKEED